MPVGAPPSVRSCVPAPAALLDAKPSPGGVLDCQLPFKLLILYSLPPQSGFSTHQVKDLLCRGPPRGELPPHPIPLICTLSLCSVWEKPFCPVMPKRKVTFQGVGDDDEDEISVPKKKVRGPDSSVLRRSEGGGKLVRSQKRDLERQRKDGKGRLFRVFLRSGLAGFSV